MTKEQSDFIDKIKNLSVELDKVAKRTRTLGQRDDALSISEAAIHLTMFAQVLHTATAVADLKAAQAAPKPVSRVLRP